MEETTTSGSQVRGPSAFRTFIHNRTQSRQTNEWVRSWDGTETFGRIVEEIERTQRVVREITLAYRPGRPFQLSEEAERIVAAWGDR